MAMVITVEVTLTSTFRKQHIDALGKTYQNTGDKATLKFSDSRDFEEFQAECNSENGWCDIDLVCEI